MKLAVLSATLLLAMAAPGAAQERIPSHCLAFAQGPERVLRASYRDSVAADTVLIRYVDHAMFLLRTPNVAAMTDFTGWVGNVDWLPDVVTMNRAHSTHWTAAPDPAIPHVLPGWGEEGAAADHYLDLGEMLVRNVPTDIRSGYSGTTPDGNSIFVFEAAGLCIGHVGHLHHEPTEENYALLGRMDVVMVPVDGGLTLSHEALVRTMDRLRASVVIPMHWFGRGTLDAFLDDMADSGYAVERLNDASLVMSRDALPDRPTVMVLEPRVLSD